MNTTSTIQDLVKIRKELYGETREKTALTEDEVSALADQQNAVERQIALMQPTSIEEAAAQLRVAVECYRDAHPDLPDPKDLEPGNHCCEAVDAALMERVLGFLETQVQAHPPVNGKWKGMPGLFYALIDGKAWKCEPAEGGKVLSLQSFDTADNETRLITDAKEIQALYKRFGGVRSPADFYERPNLWQPNEEFAKTIGEARKHPAYHQSMAQAGARRLEIRRYIADNEIGEEQQETLWLEQEACEQRIADGAIQTHDDLQAAIDYARHLILNDYVLGDTLIGYHIHLLAILQGVLRVASQPKI